MTIRSEGGPQAGLELDLTPAGMSHSWQALVALYGFDRIVELFIVGLEQSEPRQLANHIQYLRDLISQIEDKIGDEEGLEEEEAD